MARAQPDPDCGGSESHLEEVKVATRAWLEHEYRTSPIAPDDDETRSYKINLAEGVLEQPEQPEPLAILRKLRRFHLTMWQGGYADQPYLLMAELNAVVEAELEHEALVTLNHVMELQAKQRLAEAQQNG